MENQPCVSLGLSSNYTKVQSETTKSDQKLEEEKLNAELNLLYLEKKQAEQELNMIKSEISDREVKNNNLNASMSSSAVLESLGRLKNTEFMNRIIAICIRAQSVYREKKLVSVMKEWNWNCSKNEIKTEKLLRIYKR